MKKKNKIKAAHEVSEKLAVPLSPLGLPDKAKTIVEAHSETEGKKEKGKQNWIVKYNTDIAIFLGAIWSIGRVLYFYYPDRTWTVWIKFVDTFLPLIAITIAIIYRLYPKINVFFLTEKK